MAHSASNSRLYLDLRGHAVAQWLRRYATRRKVAGSSPPHEGNDFCQFTLSFRPVFSASNKSGRRIFLERKALSTRKAGNLNAMCWTDFLENVGLLTSQKPVGHHGLLRR
jgi:hypothetical protein